jgi:hypothetical protein
MFFGTNGSLYVSREGLEVHPDKERIPAYKRGGSAQSEPHAENFLAAIREGRAVGSRCADRRALDDCAAAGQYRLPRGA